LKTCPKHLSLYTASSTRKKEGVCSQPREEKRELLSFFMEITGEKKSLCDRKSVK